MSYCVSCSPPATDEAVRHLRNMAEQFCPSTRAKPSAPMMKKRRAGYAG